MATATSERVRMKTKLAFGVGAIGEAGPYIAFQSFNMIFYNVVLGLPGSLCGLAVFLALVFDAVADPVIGFWSDRVRTRIGRRHPFMYAAPIPLALSFYCIYAPPLRVHQEDVPLPYAANLEALALPSVEKIVKAAKAVSYK